MHDQRLDPEVQKLLDEIEAEGGPAFDTLPVEEARRLAAEGLREYGGELEPVLRIENLKIAGGIPLRVYTPDRVDPGPGVVYFHGGGWVLCDLDTHEIVCRAIAARSGAVVIAVDYRLAPEHRFPAAVDDCFAALKWVADNAHRLGIDPEAISVGGDSAGGNLATVVALKARDEKGPAIAGQVLVYPVTNLSSFETGSYEEFADGYYLTRSEMEWFRRCYLARPEDGCNPHASPLLATNLSGLPPALVITAECDVLRDEGEAYARRLHDAGVKTVCTRYHGVIHPFFSLPGRLDQANQAIDEFAKFVAATASGGRR